MHTTKVNDAVFIHNGDYEGEVIISLPKKAVEDVVPEGATDDDRVRVKIPFDALKRFVVNHVRSRKIAALEDAKDNEVLGIK